MNTSIKLAATFVLIISVSCGNQNVSTDSNVSVPTGDPPFTPVTTSWVVDNAHALQDQTIKQCDAICQRLQNDGIAEMVVLIQPGVEHPNDYATHYGRWLKLGEKGLSTQGGNNGVVWLIRPDADEKMTYSIGRGLPKLTSSHMVDIMNSAKEYFNFNNYDTGVLVLVQETDQKLRKLYGGKKGGNT